MDERNFFNGIKKVGKNVLKATLPFFLKVFLPISLILVILFSATYLIKLDDGAIKEGDSKNVPNVVSENCNTITYKGNGVFETAKSAQELWDELKKNGGRASAYLDNAEQLKKLIDAELVTQYLDTRPSQEDDPNAESHIEDDIDWNSISKDTNSKEIHGMVKLKRKDENGNESYMTFMEKDEFQNLIDQYNKTGDEALKEKILKHFTIDEASGASNNTGVITGNGKFTTYDLSDDQLEQIASLCMQEQGSAQGAAAEASLMANLFEIQNKATKYGSGADGLYNYVRNGGWFAHAATYMDKKNASSDIIEAVDNVLRKGYRTIPQYIDEHDSYSDITSASPKNNGNYVQFQTIIKNKYGSTYTYYSNPAPGSDPFGYTSEANRTKYGDAYYEYGTWKLINGTDSDSSSTTQSSSSDVFDKMLFIGDSWGDRT